MSQNVPKIVFIVPYRNRPQHKFFFSNYLTTIMNDHDNYEIYFSHQCDARSFNRGATKNIGFLAIKNKYPNHYQNITFVFNDIDTIPFSTILDFKTETGVVKHFYGFKYALGGIVALKGSDFELTNGYPNFWGWGMEDNVLQKRCEAVGLLIDRSHFYPIGSPEILHLFDGVSRIINRKDPWRATHDNGIDGLKTIYKLDYTIDFDSKNPIDNVHVVNFNNIYMININTFMTGTRFEHDNYFKYDLREPPRKIIHPDRVKTNKIDYITDDWSNIPFYPSSEKKQEMIEQYGKEKAEEIIEYSYENSTDPTQETLPPEMIPQQSGYQQQQQQHFQQQQQQQYQQQQQQYQQQQQQYQQQQQQYQQQYQQQQQQQFQDQLVQIQRYNEYMRQINSNQRIIPPNINKFSPAYSRIIASRPKASKSANIRLGGVY
jgi:hypothetical protein